jgi:predicted YcjX-like family ATPase
MDSRPTRAAKNEAIYREVNERIVELTDTFAAEGLEIVCECSHPDCVEIFQITVTEYVAVRSHGNRFAVIAGHEDLTVERVYDQNERFLIVEKIGEAGDVARALDPR